MPTPVVLAPRVERGLLLCQDMHPEMVRRFRNLNYPIFDEPAKAFPQGITDIAINSLKGLHFREDSKGLWERKFSDSPEYSDSFEPVGKTRKFSEQTFWYSLTIGDFSENVRVQKGCVDLDGFLDSRYDGESEIFEVAEYFDSVFLARIKELEGDQFFDKIQKVIKVYDNTLKQIITSAQSGSQIKWEALNNENIDHYQYYHEQNYHIKGRKGVEQVVRANGIEHYPPHPRSVISELCAPFAEQIIRKSVGKDGGYHLNQFMIITA